MPVIIDEHTQYFNNGASVVNGFVYIGEVNTDPTILANRLTLFSDAALTIVVPNPQRTNARGQTLDGPIFTAEGSFSFELQNSGSVVIESILSMGGTTGGLSLATLFDVAGINAITAKGDPVVIAYVDKQQYSLTIISEPTGAMTLDIDGNGVVPIKNKGADIVPGQFPANGLIVVAFNSIGPVFELVSGANLSVPSPIGDVTPNSIQGTTIEGTTIKATTTFEAASGTTINEFSSDGTLGGNSDDAVPTEQAVKTAIAAAVKVLQVVIVFPVNVLSTTSVIPRDNTAPQLPEGLEVMSLAITPKNTASTLLIEVTVFGGSTGTEWTIALFKDSDTFAVAVASDITQASGTGGSLSLGYTDPSVSLTARTFKIRMGTTNGTAVFNQTKELNTFGGVVSKSFIKITEILF